MATHRFERAELESRLSCLYRLLREIEDLDDQRSRLLEFERGPVPDPKARWGSGAFAVVMAAWAAVVLMGTLVGAALCLPKATLAGVLADGPGPTSLISVAGALVLTVPLAAALARLTVTVRNHRIDTVNAARSEADWALMAKARTQVAPALEWLEHLLANARLRYRQTCDGWFPERYLSVQDVGECWQIVHDHRADTLADALCRYAEDEAHRYAGNPERMDNAEQRRADRVLKMRAAVGSGGSAQRCIPAELGELGRRGVQLAAE